MGQSIVLWLDFYLFFAFQVMCQDSSFDELLNLVEMNHQLACDPDARGCGKHNHIHHFLSTPPHVFTTGSPSHLFTLSGFVQYFQELQH